jgi:hypothetical protein
MKRFAPFIACCYLCSLFLPLSLRANVLPVSESTVTGAAADDYYKSSRAQLKVLSNNKIGQTLVASEALSSTAALSGLVSGAAGLAGVAYYERTGKDPVYAAFNAVATAADALFVPAYQAFKANFVSPESYPASAAQYVGVEGSVGAKLGDIVDFVKGSSSSAYDGLRNLFNSVSNDGFPSPEGQVVQMDHFLLRFPTTWNYQNYYSYNPQASLTDTYGNLVGTYYAIDSSATLPIGATVKIWKIVYPHYVNGVANYRLFWGNGVVVGDPATVNQSSTVDYPLLKTQLQANLNAALADEIRNAVKAMPNEQKITSSDPAPETAPSSSPQPITNTQIQNFFAQNTTNVYNKTLETITNNSTSTTTEITNEVAGAASEAAKAQEEEATKETEETFNPITASAFEEPYNPGEFDIPARFTQFLNNVKSSGLFSFSNDFFNSLPGGGSSVYEIEAGRYGHHTIDLSDTLSTGLAVLKTIFLVCFGFLSIRAVIMKR